MLIRLQDCIIPCKTFNKYTVAKKSSQVNFIYIVPNHNRSYLMTLSMQSRSRPYSVIYRDPTVPP